MIYRKLSPSGDYVLGNQNDFYSGTDAVAQAIYTSLKLLQGEWWEDTSIGFSLFQTVLGQTGTPEHQHGVDMLVQESILGVQGVQSISNYSSVYANRKYTFNADVQTIYGTVGLREVAFGP